MSQREHGRKEEGKSLVEFYADTSTAALPRDVLELLNPIQTTLGYSVHRQAIFRLLDIWPEAHIHVIHRRPIMVSEEAVGMDMAFADGATNSFYTNAQRLHWEKEHGIKLPFATHGGETLVMILPNRDALGKGLNVDGVAGCHYTDQFNKKRGVEVAFNRALKKLSQREKLAVPGCQEV